MKPLNFSEKNRKEFFCWAHPMSVLKSKINQLNDHDDSVENNYSIHFQTSLLELCYCFFTSSPTRDSRLFALLEDGQYALLYERFELPLNQDLEFLQSTFTVKSFDVKKKLSSLHREQKFARLTKFRDPQ
jgi:hypothetical protein